MGLESRQRWMQKRQEYVRLLNGVLEQGMGEGVFRPVDTGFAAHALLSLVFLLLSEGSAASAADMAARALDILTNGIRA